MNPRLSPAGRSFKFTALYMSHDKQAQTSDRLGFVAFRNLPIEETGNGPEDSERAAKIMAFTAMHWEDLQRAHFKACQDAGEIDASKVYRRPPRPSEKPVLTYSLRFHPDDKDKITRELLESAADESLKRLGLENHQAVIYEHTDFDGTPEHPHHPSHIHVVVSKVHPTTGLSRNHTHVVFDPDTGKDKKINNSKLVLSTFAEEFGKQHGLKKVHQRTVNNWRRSNGEFVLYEDVPRADYERFKTYENKSDRTVKRERREQQESDIVQLDSRHPVKRREFENDLAKRYGKTRQQVVDELELSNRKIAVDHMSGIFRVLTRLKQRITGELRRELIRQEGLNRTIREIDDRMVSERTEHEDRLAREVAKLNAVHVAQLRRDDEYFEWRRTRRKTETAGESGRKAYRAAAQDRAKKEPDPALRAKIVEQHRQSAEDPRDDAATRMAKRFGQKQKIEPRRDDAPTTPAEAVEQALSSDRKYSRKRVKEHGRGVDRKPGRKRPGRNRKR